MGLEALGSANTAGEAANQEPADVELLMTTEGHEDSVASIHMTSQPWGLVTCGHDRRVRLWGLNLDNFGILLQSKDDAFKFPYDPVQAQKAKLAEGAEVLKRIGPWKPAERMLPPLAPQGTRTPDEALACLTIGGKRKPRVRDPDAVWKTTAEHVIADDEAGEEDYRILFEQMERLAHGPPAASSEPPAAETLAQDRLHRNAHARHADKMLHRTTALSRDEAAAADRLARAMAALGGDDFGTYEAMARAIAPKARAEPVAED